jgi:transposase
VTTVTELSPVAYVGIDWATKDHAICVLGTDGHKSASFMAEHSKDGLAKVLSHLGGLGPRACVPVGLERPDGRLVDALLEAGHPVVAVNPAAIKAWRESEVVSGAKDDPGDAEVIAEYLRLRAHKLAVLEPFSAETRALRAVVRARDDLVDQRVALTNQLSACLDAFWPGPKALFCDLASSISLAFLERYPTPSAAEGLGEKRMAAFLAKNSYSGRTPAPELLRRLREAPDGIGALAGLRPVTNKSGKHAAVNFRWACDKRFRKALTTFAGNSRHASPWAADIYRRAIARGCDHPHAVRVLARAWVRVIWRCWADGVAYDPAKHGGARRLGNATDEALSGAEAA